MKKHPKIGLALPLSTTAALILAALMLASCGGSGGGGTVPPPLSPDFTLTVQPANVTVAQGSSASVTVAITGLNGFSSQTSIAVTGMPSGVTAAPTQCTLAPGGQQAVNINAASTVATGSVNLTVTATSGSLTHTGQIALAVNAPPDFTLTIQPTSVTLAPGSSTTVSVGLTGANGFASQASITLTGMPAGVTPTPSEFNLSASGQETVTLSADSTAALGSATLTVTATSGSLDHAGQIALAVTYPQTSVFPPFRTRYVRTDAQGGICFLYEPVTKRFFISNTYLNRIDVFDATTELKIGEITIPEPWVGDETPDHTKIYMATQIGDVYEIDPVAMEVTKRFPALQIGPSGFAAYEAHVMADGTLALLGGQGGIPSVDGYAYFAVWNPADNSMQTFIPQSGTGTYWGVVAAQPAGCVGMGNIGEFTLSADRTKILLGSIFSDNTLCSFDPSTRDVRYVTVPSVSIGLGSILVPPDGDEIISPSGTTVTIYDSTGLYQTDQFQLAGGSGDFAFILSFDGSTLYVVDGMWGGPQPTIGRLINRQGGSPISPWMTSLEW